MNSGVFEILGVKVHPHKAHILGILGTVAKENEYATDIDEINHQHSSDETRKVTSHARHCG